MARKTTPKPGTAIVSWEDKLAEQAAQAAEAEKLTGGGKFFSTQAGVLKFDDTPMPGNQMAVIILDGIHENLFYGTAYDPDNRAPPKCFAFSRTDDGELIAEEDMQPHPRVDEDMETFERQSEDCASCPMNKFGSADKGKGKACGNRRRLAVIPAGVYQKQRNGGFELELIDDEDVLRKADMAFLKLPVMSAKGYSQYVHSLSGEMRRPPHGVITRIFLEPDSRSQFRINFEMLEKVPDELMEVVMARHEEVTKAIAFPYSAFVPDEDEAPKPARKASSSAKLSRGRKK